MSVACATDMLVSSYQGLTEPADPADLAVTSPKLGSQPLLDPLSSRRRAALLPTLATRMNEPEPMGWSVSLAASSVLGAVAVSAALSFVTQTARRPMSPPRIVAQPDLTAAVQSLGEWRRWLDKLTDEQATMPAEHVRRLWRTLGVYAGVPLQAPAAGPGGELSFYFAWHREDVYLDIDLAPDGRFEWFWTNRRTGEAEGSEDERLTTPPEALIRHLVKDFHLR